MEDNEIQIIRSPISINLIKDLAKKQFGNLIKATVDIDKEILALGGELHADEEQVLLDSNSKQVNLWGVNLYPDKFGTDEFIEYDSMINIRPSQGNISRNVEDPIIRSKISLLINNLIIVNIKNQNAA